MSFWSMFGVSFIFWNESVMERNNNIDDEIISWMKIKVENGFCERLI